MPVGAIAAQRFAGGTQFAGGGPVVLPQANGSDSVEFAGRNRSDSANSSNIGIMTGALLGCLGCCLLPIAAIAYGLYKLRG